MLGSDFAGDIPDQKSSWHAKGIVIVSMVRKTFSLEYEDAVDRHGLRYISPFVICGFSWSFSDIFLGPYQIILIFQLKLLEDEEQINKKKNLVSYTYMRQVSFYIHIGDMFDFPWL